ncbi:MAG: Coenzyme F420 hydrogenase/dehydrogenase, beta subunit C-terminal domain [Eubacterium sp.]|nr:Coenzyme F420 hydrogenase/dehydrogenase, beta subunit C-terminal domain [Eubacterium sp.]
MIDSICDKSKCTACFACSNSCPVGAVTLKADKNGRVYPVISESCTECGLCLKVCPVNSPVVLNAPLEAFAFYSKDGEIRSSSTSGGLIHSAASVFDGIVYGAAYTDGLNVDCIRIEDKSELYRIQGSKYVHSHVNAQYASVKGDLESGKRVLFIGTPCQAAGLRSYLKKDYEGLYIIDFVCHGVCERQLLKDYISGELTNADLNKATVRFRDSKGYNMTVSENGNKTVLPFSTNFYYHGFLEGWSLRENCHGCLYSRIERAGDLTACDCWGGNEEIKAEMKNGLNGVLVNTDKGRELLDSVKNNAVIIESSVNEARSGVVHLRHPMAETGLSMRFRMLSEKHGGYYALKNTVLKKKLAFMVRKIKNAGNSNN